LGGRDEEADFFARGWIVLLFFFFSSRSFPSLFFCPFIFLPRFLISDSILGMVQVLALFLA
jgi:hypothetical protein